MKFVPPDTCLADYQARRSAFIKQLVADTPDDMQARADGFCAWIDENSPYDYYEKLRNLKQALTEDSP